MIEEDIQELDAVVVEKPSKAKRYTKSLSARQKRKETKHIKEIHSYKEEKDARERLRAKRLLEKQKKLKT